VIVRVVAVGMLQTAVDKVVDVVAVGNRLVTAIRPVLVTGLPSGPVRRIALVRVRRRHLDHVLDSSAVFLVDQAAPIEKVYVPLMPHCGAAL
jgi:hypothetical protein